MIELAGKALPDMEALSARGEPAVAAIDSAVADALGPLDNTERQHGGRIVRDQLAPLGLRPKAIRKRLRGGRAFTSGTVYGLVKGMPDPLLSHGAASTMNWEERTLARTDEAIAMLAKAHTGSGGLLDDFIA